MTFIHLVLASLLLHATSAQWGYSDEEIDVFDLAAEFDGNFYEFMDIPQNSETSDIRRAYRRLSLTMHPDKNKTEGAAENFRFLAAIYEVLKNKEKREIYDNVLYNGIPAAYLYVPKPLRKMDLTEVSIIIALILTLGHYLLMWGHYAEQRLVMEQYLPRIKKKKQKAKKKNESDSNIENEITSQLEKPKFRDLLPVAIGRGLYNFVKFVPGFIQDIRAEAAARKEDERLRKEEEERELQLRLEEQAKREEQKVLRKQKAKAKREEMLQYVATPIKEGGNFYSPFDEGDSVEEIEQLYDPDEDDKKSNNKKREWRIEDESNLVKFMSKYPAGSSQRWHRIADEMDKPVAEIIQRAKQIKNKIGNEDTGARQKIKVNNKVDPNAFDEMVTVRHPETTENPPDSSESGGWSSTLQKIFEMAIKQFPKGTPARWDKIAACVPSKSKEECVARYKELVEMVQKKQTSKTKQ